MHGGDYEFGEDGGLGFGTTGSFGVNMQDIEEYDRGQI